MNTLAPPAIRSIDHVHVFVSDRAASEHWYESVLGFSRIKEYEFWAADGGPLTVQNKGGTVHIALFERPPVKCRSTIAFSAGAEEFLAWKLHLAKALGREPALDDHDLALSLYFQDPDGNPYEITTYEHRLARQLLAKSAA
jgi:catechol 2,3-dioxygenase-like lactoylglutathione lyase family enzyme